MCIRGDVRPNAQDVGFVNQECGDHFMHICHSGIAYDDTGTNYRDAVNELGCTIAKVDGWQRRKNL